MIGFSCRLGMSISWATLDSINEFLNKKLLKRLTKDFQEEQLKKTISEIDYLNQIQKHVLEQTDLSESENNQLDFLKKLNNARKNLQIQA